LDDAVVESLVARIACVGQIGIGLVEGRAVFGLDRAVEVLKGLLRDGGDHVWKGDVVLSRVGLAKAPECAAEISKLVSGKFPVSCSARQSSAGVESSRS
jgi:hypothetical protein